MDLPAATFRCAATLTQGILMKKGLVGQLNNYTMKMALKRSTFCTVRMMSVKLHNSQTFPVVRVPCTAPSDGPCGLS